MEDMDFKSRILAKACRLCATMDNTIEMYQIFGTLNYEYSIPDIIKKCLDIEILENDECQNICEICLAKLDLMYQVHESFKKGELDFNILMRFFDVKKETETSSTRSCCSEASSEDYKPNGKTLLVVIEPLDESYSQEDRNGSTAYFKQEVKSEFLMDSDEPFVPRLPKNIKKFKMHHENFEILEKKFKCKICSKRFGMKTSRDIHLRVHTGEKPHICDLCGKRFTQLGTLTYHRRIHTGDKRFQCDVCHRKFTQKVTLTKHTKLHEKR